MLIDTHCHLNFQAFENDLEDVIARAKNAGVGKIVIPGAKIDSSEKAITIAQGHNDCFAAVGIHPHHVDELLKYKSIKVLKDELITLAKQKKVVAIGETGLDYFEYKSSVYTNHKLTSDIKAKQKELLKIHLEVASELKLPIILHCREAFGDMLPIVKQYSSNGVRSSRPTVSNNKNLRGVFHCFGGTDEDLQKVLEMGFYIGFDGNITFTNASNLRELAKLTPLEKILIETDSPYLSPEPYRGKRNEPKNVKMVANEIAKTKGFSEEEVEITTTNNALKLFFERSEKSHS